MGIISDILDSAPWRWQSCEGLPRCNMDMGEVFEVAARQAAEKHPRDSTRASEGSEESDSGEEMAEDVVQPSSPPRNRAVQG